MKGKLRSPLLPSPIKEILINQYPFLEKQDQILDDDSNELALMKAKIYGTQAFLPINDRCPQDSRASFQTTSKRERKKERKRRVKRDLKKIQNQQRKKKKK